MILIITAYTIIFKKPVFQHDLYKIKTQNSNTNFSKMLTSSILSSIKTLTLISGLVILFFVIAAVMDEVKIIDNIYYLFADVSIDKSPLKPLLFGFLEMTAGCIKTGSSALSFNTKTALCSGLIGFGGLSIYAQTKSILSIQNIKAKGLLLIKLAHGLLSFILCSFMLKIFPIKIKTAAINDTTDNIKFLYLYIPIILLLYLIIYLRKNIKNSR